MGLDKSKLHITFEGASFQYLDPLAEIMKGNFRVFTSPFFPLNGFFMVKHDKSRLLVKLKL